MLPSVGQSNAGRRQSLDLVPDVSIEVTSKDVLNLTLTQTCINLIDELAHVSAERAVLLIILGLAFKILH